MTNATPIAGDLERYVRQLAKLSALALDAQDRAPYEVIDTMLALVVETLEVDLAYAFVRVPGLEPPIEALHRKSSTDTPLISVDLATVSERLRAMQQHHRIREKLVLNEGHPMHLASFPIWNGAGLLAIGTRRSCFPEELEASILGSVMNHLVHWMRSLQPNVAEREVVSMTDPLFVTSTPIDGAPEGLYSVVPSIDEPISFGSIVGRSAALRDILGQIDRVAPTDATVMILGESGTGKEVLAREIHERSGRADRPLIKVNCSAVPREMFETEFFGHVKGAFTGALRDRPGRFKLADKGTLFLDEVGDMPLDLQPKLLRVLQEGQFERVGDDTTISVNVRIVAATNRDLAAEVAAGRFREDLYYRLSVFPLRLPPLRNRREDILPLAEYFIAQTARALNAPTPRLSEAHLAALEAYDLPGNARELQNVIERAVILGRPGHLRLDHVMVGRGEPPPPPSSLPGAVTLALPLTEEVIPEEEWRRRERDNLTAALRRTHGRIYGDNGAAKLLGIKPSTLQSRLRVFGLNPRDFGPSLG
jgi:DNA-binding NtrC family response regulator